MSKDCILNDTFIERVGTDTKVDLTKSIGDIYVFELVKYIKTVSFNNEQLNVTVNFVAEVITCIRDKDKKIISGDPEKIKKIYDTWIFSRDTKSKNPNWQLVETLN